MTSLRQSAGIAFLFFLLVAGCDIFETRDPETPSERFSTFNPPVNPEIVLSNLKAAVAESNVDNYARSFSDTAASGRRYRFDVSPDVASSFSSVFADWSVEDERSYFQNLGKPAGIQPSLSFTNQRPVASSSDSAVYNMDYVLFYPHSRAGVPQYVRGNMQLSLGADNQRRWSIYRWQDFKTGPDSTWSYLKAMFHGN